MKLNLCILISLMLINWNCKKNQKEPKKTFTIQSEIKFLKNQAALFPSKKWTYFFKIAELYPHIDLDSAEYYAYEALRLSRSTEDSALSLIAIAQYYFWNTNKGLIFSCGGEAIRLAETLKDNNSVKAQVLISYGGLLGELENAEAIDLTYNGLDLAERIGDKFLQAQALDYISYIEKEHLGKQDSAIKTIDKAMALVKDTANVYEKLLYVDLLLNLGKLYIGFGSEKPELKGNLQKALALYKRLGGLGQKPDLFLHLGRYFVNSGFNTDTTLTKAEKKEHVDKGFEFFFKSLKAHNAKTYNRLWNIETRCRIVEALGWTEKDINLSNWQDTIKQSFNLQDSNFMLEAIKQNVRIADSLGIVFSRMKAHGTYLYYYDDTLRTLSPKNGDFTFEGYRKENNIFRPLYNSRHDHKRVAIEAKEKNNIKKKHYENRLDWKDQQTMWAIAAGILVALLLAGLAGLFWRKKELEKEIKKIMGHSVEGSLTEIEKRVKDYKESLPLKLEKEHHLLDFFQRFINNVVGTLKIIKQYKPDYYEEILLRKFIDEKIDYYLSLHNAQIKIQKNITPLVLDSKQLEKIGHIIDEIIHNALKYAFKGIDKPKLTIVLKKDPNQKRFVLRIQDNGIGFNQEDKPKGSGLGMGLIKNSIYNLGNRYKLETAKGKGTTWTIFIYKN